jgi:hypothetical protein
MSAAVDRWVVVQSADKENASTRAWSASKVTIPTHGKQRIEQRPMAARDANSGSNVSRGRRLPRLGLRFSQLSVLQVAPPGLGLNNPNSSCLEV